MVREHRWSFVALGLLTALLALLLLLSQNSIPNRLGGPADWSKMVTTAPSASP